MISGKLVDIGGLVTLICDTDSNNPGPSLGSLLELAGIRPGCDVRIHTTSGELIIRTPEASAVRNHDTNLMEFLRRIHGSTRQRNSLVGRHFTITNPQGEKVEGDITQVRQSGASGGFILRLDGVDGEVSIRNLLCEGAVVEINLNDPPGIFQVCGKRGWTKHLDDGHAPEDTDPQVVLDDEG